MKVRVNLKLVYDEVLKSHIIRPDIPEGIAWQRVNELSPHEWEIEIPDEQLAISVRDTPRDNKLKVDLNDNFSSR